MCIDSLVGGKSKSAKNIAIFQAEQDRLAREENERQRVAAQADMERRYQEQQAREAAVVAEQQRAAQAAIDQARADEARRQQIIQQSRGAVDTAFGGFNDQYYSEAAQRYTAANTPNLDDDYNKSLDKLKAALAGRGTLESSVGINQIAELDKRAAQERATIASKGMDFANSLREKVGASRNTLYDAATSAGDPAGFAARATGEATNLVNLGGVVPAGQATAYGSQVEGSGVGAPANSSVFGSILAPLVSAASSAVNAPKTVKSIGSSITAPTTGSGTSQVKN